MSDFRFHAELEAFEKAGDPNPMRIGGMVSSDSLDSQGEKIIQAGLDFSDFLGRGWYNDNHGKGSTDVVGYPTAAKYVGKGERLPSGRDASRAGWYTEGYLLNTQKGRDIWDLASALQKAPRKLGFSIEGRVEERDPRAAHIIKKAKVRNVAITHCPVNRDTELVTLAKALTAGSAIASGDIGQGPGDGGALRAESLDDGPADQAELRSEEQMVLDDLAEHGANGAQPVHKSEAPFSVEAAPDTDEVSYAESFAPAARDFIRAVIQADDQDFGRELLTRSEAQRIIVGRFPEMSAVRVDQLIKSLTQPGARP